MKTIFIHGVASADPLTDRVVIWTRVTPVGTKPVPVNWEAARDAEFKSIAASGTASAGSDSDYTVNVDVTGLEPGTRYFYRFHALGETSDVGRTGTLARDPSRVRFAQVSCAKFNAGFFNAFARIAKRDDLDFLLHLGDYIYESSNTPPASQTPGANIGRPFEPPGECKTLADYRTRYAQYRRDPYVQNMHAALPIIATIDDHEIADGAWRGGANEHDDRRDGPWSERLANAFKARWEWVPGRKPNPADPSIVYREVSFGTLADLFLLETRSKRDQPVPPPAMNDRDRTALGAAQREWLFNAFDQSAATWRLIGNPSVMATTWAHHLTDEVKQALVKVKLIAADGIAPDWDQWDGYPAERDLLLQRLRDHKLGNVIVISGDVHVAMVNELKRTVNDPHEMVIATEFVNPSLTSQNLDDKMNWEPRTQSLEIERVMMQEMPHVKWIDLDSHGYNIVDVTPERVQVEFWFVDTVLKPSGKEKLGSRWEIKSGGPRAARVE